MADDRLRTLGRDAANDPLVRARWLGERLRAGELDERRLQLAAFLGDPAAQAVVSAGEPPDDLVV